MNNTEKRTERPAPISTEVHRTPSPQPEESQAAARQAVEESRLFTPDQARLRELTRCSDMLEKLNAAQAVAAISGQSPYMRDVFLIAEEQGQNRTDVLRRFPKPGHIIRAHFA